MLIGFGLYSVIAVSGQSVNDLLLSEYRQVRHAVCEVVINGSDFCTGTVINHTSSREGLYIITAGHCISNSDAIHSVYFSFGEFALLNNTSVLQSSKWQSNGQFELLAFNKELDFALFYIDHTPPRHMVTYQLGWDIQSLNPPYGVSFHHGEVDLQRTAIGRNVISPASFIGYPSEANAFWRVSGWGVGRTDLGSSGAGLIDHRLRFLGGLSGSTVTNSDTIDYFFRFDFAYNRFQELDQQLAHWIDPEQQGIVNGGPLNDLFKLNLYEEYETYTDDFSVTSEHSFTQLVAASDQVTVLGVYLSILTYNELVPFSELHLDFAAQDGEVFYSQNVLLVDLSENQENYIELFEPVVTPANFQIQLSIPDDQDARISLPLLESGNAIIGMLVDQEMGQAHEDIVEPIRTKIFPNPTNSYSYIPATGVIQITCFNAQGHEVFPKINQVNGEYIVNWHGVNPGLYFVNIVLGNGKKSYFRLIIRD